MEWQLKTTPTNKGVVAPRVLAHGAIPVLLSATGRYSEFVSSAGETSNERPHVKVSLAEAMSHGAQGSDCWVDHVYVYAVGSLKNGRQQTLPVVAYQKCQPARTEEEILALIDSLAPKIAEAISLCGRLDEVFQEAQRRTAVIGQLKDGCATREGYEAACATAGVDSMMDADIATSYGIAYGEFSFPEYSPEVVVQMALARHRKQALDAEAKLRLDDRAPQLSAAMPVKAGQLWEPCRCGREPVYMPLHLCDSCWPKGL
ncbi:hypothetical protein [Azotobacter vinelandii]